MELTFIGTLPLAGSGEHICDASGPVALNTVFGWVLSGSCGGSNVSEVLTNLIYSSHVLKVDAQSVSTQVKNITEKRDQDVIESVSKFWEVEDLGLSEQNADDTDGEDTEVSDISKKISEEFKQGVTFDADARRYSTELPKRCNMDILPDNYFLTL